MSKIDHCDTMRNNLIAAALGLQQCTKTAANIVPLPGTDRFIAIGTPAEVARLLETAPAAEMIRIGSLMSNVMYNLAQRPGKALAADDCESMDNLRKLWDAARAVAPAAQVQADLSDAEIIAAVAEIYLSDFGGKGTQAYDIAVARAVIEAMKSKRAASTDGEANHG